MKGAFLFATGCFALFALSNCTNVMNGKPLPAPTDITVVALSPTSLRISWSAPSGAEGCNLYRSNSETGIFIKINPWLVTDSFYEDTGLAANTQYWYKLVALRDGEEQTSSAAHSGTTDPEPLGAPTNVKVVYLTDSSLRVSWDALSESDGYNVYRSSSQYGTFTKVNTIPVSSLFYDDGGLTPATEYWYKAAGVRGGVEQAQCGAVEGYTGQRWAKSYGGSSGESATFIQQTADGGYIVAGYTTSFGAGSSDFWVLKLASDGTVSWQKAYGGSSEDKASSIQQTADGGYIVAGHTQSFGAGSSDFWVLKLTSDGTVSWQKAYGSSSEDTASSIQQTTDGGYIVAGTHPANYGDFWVLKLAADGAVSWEKRYGDALEDGACSIQQTTDGGYIVAGSTFAVGYGLDNVWILKLDSAGAVTWQKSYNGGGVDTASSIQQTTDGGYIVSGKTYSFGADMADFWVLKLASDGAVSWQKLCGGWSIYGGINDCAHAVRQTTDGGYVVAGYTETYQGYDAWVLKLASNGSLSWKQAYGGEADDIAYSIQATTDGGSVVAGYTGSFGVGGSDLWVMKLPIDGELHGADFRITLSSSFFSSSAAPNDTAVTAAVTTASVNGTAAAGQDTSCTVSTQYP
jgi:uncharacterized delta-60 repeat protein